MILCITFIRSNLIIHMTHIDDKPKLWREVFIFVYITHEHWELKSFFEMIESHVTYFVSKTDSVSPTQSV